MVPGKPSEVVFPQVLQAGLYVVSPVGAICLADCFWLKRPHESGPGGAATAETTTTATLGVR
jgi:hypothetical protein